MKVFILDVECLTNAYHDSGGLVAIAKDRRHVRKLWNDHLNLTAATYGTDERKLTDEELAKAKVCPTSDDAKAELFIFPDSGCC